MCSCSPLAREDQSQVCASWETPFPRPQVTAESGPFLTRVSPLGLRCWVGGGGILGKD